MIILGIILAVIGAFISRLLLYLGVALIILGVLFAVSGHVAY